MITSWDQLCYPVFPLEWGKKRRYEVGSWEEFPPNPLTEKKLGV